MKISKNTLSILKNFSVINPGIQFKKGNVLRTISNQKNIYAKCVFCLLYPWTKMKLS